MRILRRDDLRSLSIAERCFPSLMLSVGSWGELAERGGFAILSVRFFRVVESIHTSFSRVRGDPLNGTTGDAFYRSVG